MKKTFFLLPLLLALWLLPGGCKKDPQGPGVAGWVREFGTDKPIPNASAYGIDCEGEPLGPVTCFKTDTTRTDADGYYSMPQEPGWVGAEAPGYWKGDQVPVLYKKELATNVSLYPFAWLKVTIRNESGAYGFFPPQNGSGYPPIQLGQSQDTTLGVELKKGNDITKYIFTVKTEEGGGFPDQDYWQNVKAFANGTPVDLTIGTGAFLEFYLTGHDTTNLLIIY